jgi:small subunit ribosomal protein S20
MAHHKSALKRIRQSRKRRLFNREKKRLIRVAVRAVKEAKTYEEAVEKLGAAYSILDKVSIKGIIHKNNAANTKASLNKHVESLKQQPQEA